jgi:hypothetical protein
VGIWPGTGAVYSGSDKENDDENDDDDDDDRDLPTIEELLFTKLQEQGSAGADGNPSHRDRGVEEAAGVERVRSIDRNGPALGDKSGGSLGERAHSPFFGWTTGFSDTAQKIQSSCRAMTTRAPLMPKLVTMVFAPKVQHQARDFLIAQREPSTRQPPSLLAVPIGGTILITSTRRLRACRLQTRSFGVKLHASSYPFFAPLE